MKVDGLARRLDARFNLPRRADSQHHSSYRALIELATSGLQGVTLALCSFVSLCCLAAIGLLLDFSMTAWEVVAFFALVVVALAGFEVWDLFLPYYRIFQRETFGAARFATRDDMEEHGILQPKTNESFCPRDGLWFLLWKIFRRKKHGVPSPDSISLGGFDFFYDFALKLVMFTLHVIVLGPQGSGKTASFIMKVVRAWGRVGAVMALDPKREIHQYCSRYFKTSYLLDLIDPTFSDRLSFVASCKGDPQFAHEVAAMMIGFDPNKAAATSRDPFWPMAATAFLKALLLYVAEISDRAHPGMIYEFLAARRITRDEEVGEIIDSLDEDLLSCENEEVRLAWGVFRQADLKTQGNIIISMTVMLEPFRDPNALLLFSPPTEEEKASGVREIPMSALREKGSAVFVTVSISQSKRLQVVISTIFSLAAAYLRSTGNMGKPYCLMAMDEIGNVMPLGLAEDMNMGRGLDMAYLLGVQAKSQLSAKLGADPAEMVWDGVGTIIALPGTKGRAAEMMVKLMGKTTVLQHSSTDAVDDKRDNERLAEVGRELMTEDAIRMMLKHTQAVAVTGTAPPIRFAFPPDQTEVDPRKDQPKRHVLSAPPTLGLKATEPVKREKKKAASKPQGGRGSKGGTKAAKGSQTAEVAKGAVEAKGGPGDNQKKNKRHLYPVPDPSPQQGPEVKV
jgi:type IV secretory pathway TraG/TraD family ATPase VirD4